MDVSFNVIIMSTAYLKNWTSVDYRPPKSPKYKWGLMIVFIIIAALIYMLS